MTKEEILAMEAGLELDRLIEVHIFGHQDAKVVKEYSSVWVGGAPSSFYSTDISAAWLVVKKMLEMEFLISLITHCANPNYYEVEFHKPFRTGTPMFVDALEQVPKAICKAALLAKLEPSSGS